MEVRSIKLSPGIFEKSPSYGGALQVLQKLQSSGFESYFAGGCVRDHLLGQIPKDFDIATAATPDQMKSLFPKTIPLGERFGTVGVLIGETVYQATTFRQDHNYEDGRHPQSVEFSNAKEDALRRDFTINGLFADPVQALILDYVGGIEDLAKKTLRAIGDPKKRFEEDALRLLRAVRFSARFQFEIESKTKEAIQALAPTVLRVSAERIRDELNRILSEGPASAGFRLLDEMKLLEVILPEISAMKGVEQPLPYHPEGDVFVHTLMVLDRIEPRTLILLWAALLHDVGKPPTFEISDRIRFNRHDALGAKMTESILHRLHFSNQEIERVVALVREHLRIADLPKMRESKRKRFLRDPYLEEHLSLHRADCLSSHGKLEIYEYIRKELATLSPEQLSPTRLLRGEDLLALGYRPSPLFRKILDELEEEQLEGRIQSKEQALAWLGKNFPKID